MMWVCIAFLLFDEYRRSFVQFTLYDVIVCNWCH